jgi:hypothetical protein
MVPVTRPSGSPVSRPGSAYLYPSNTQGVVNEIFDDIPCVAACNATTASAP